MPIIEIPTLNDSLNQGDLLRGVTLFSTAYDTTGGKEKSHKTNLCLVLSRPCVIAHKKSIIVAAIQKDEGKSPTSLPSFDNALEFLTRLRDGGGQPDIFYLGQLPMLNTEGRYVARFDSLHTIEITPEPEQRQKFVLAHRFARLHIDFQRSLHSRLFESFCTLGFEDISWFSDQDLRYLLETGEAEINRLSAEIEALRAIEKASGQKSKEIESKTNNINTLQRKMLPYKQELEYRVPART